jgi:hypothetical protein
MTGSCHIDGDMIYGKITGFGKPIPCLGQREGIQTHEHTAVTATEMGMNRVVMAGDFVITDTPCCFYFPHDTFPFE